MKPLEKTKTFEHGWQTDLAPSQSAVAASYVDSVDGSLWLEEQGAPAWTPRRGHKHAWTFSHPDYNPEDYHYFLLGSWHDEKDTFFLVSVHPIGRRGNKSTVEQIPQANILFWATGTGGASPILVLDWNAEAFPDEPHRLLHYTPVAMTGRRDEENRLVLYWASESAAPCAVTLQWVGKEWKPVIDPRTREKAIFYELQADVKPSLVRLKDVGFGGKLLSGVYQYAVRYISEDGYVTPWTPLCPPVFVFKNMRRGLESYAEDVGEETNLQVLLYVQNIDKRYKLLQVAYVYFKVVEQADHAAIFTTIDLTQTPSFQSEAMDTIIVAHRETTGISLSVEELMQIYQPIERAHTCTIAGNRLLLGNLKYRRRLPTPGEEREIQRSVEVRAFAVPLSLVDKPETPLGLLDGKFSPMRALKVSDITNTIKLPLFGLDNLSEPFVSFVLPPTGERNFRDPIVCHALVGYRRNEVYRFGALLIDRKGMPLGVIHLADVEMPPIYGGYLRWKNKHKSSQVYVRSSVASLGYLSQPALSNNRMWLFAAHTRLNETLLANWLQGRYNEVVDFSEIARPCLVVDRPGEPPTNNLFTIDRGACFPLSLGLRFQFVIPESLRKEVSAVLIVRAKRAGRVKAQGVLLSCPIFNVPHDAAKSDLPGVVHPAVAYGLLGYTSSLHVAGFYGIYWKDNSHYSFLYGRVNSSGQVEWVAPVGFFPAGVPNWHMRGVVAAFHSPELDFDIAGAAPGDILEIQAMAVGSYQYLLDNNATNWIHIWYAPLYLCVGGEEERRIFIRQGARPDIPGVVVKYDYGQRDYIYEDLYCGFGIPISKVHSPTYGTAKIGTSHLTFWSQSWLQLFSLSPPMGTVIIGDIRQTKSLPGRKYQVLDWIERAERVYRRGEVLQGSGQWEAPVTGVPSASHASGLPQNFSEYIWYDGVPRGGQTFPGILSAFPNGCLIIANIVNYSQEPYQGLTDDSLASTVYQTAGWLLPLNKFKRKTITVGNTTILKDAIVDTVVFGGDTYIDLYGMALSLPYDILEVPLAAWQSFGVMAFLPLECHINYALETGRLPKKDGLSVKGGKGGIWEGGPRAIFDEGGHGLLWDFLDTHTAQRLLLHESGGAPYFGVKPLLRETERTEFSNRIAYSQTAIAGEDINHHRLFLAASFADMNMELGSVQALYGRGYSFIIGQERAIAYSEVSPQQLITTQGELPAKVVVGGGELLLRPIYITQNLGVQHHRQMLVSPVGLFGFDVIRGEFFAIEGDNISLLGTEKGLQSTLQRWRTQVPPVGQAYLAASANYAGLGGRVFPARPGLMTIASLAYNPDDKEIILILKRLALVRPHSDNPAQQPTDTTLTEQIAIAYSTPLRVFVSRLQFTPDTVFNSSVHIWGVRPFGERPADVYRLFGSPLFGVSVRRDGSLLRHSPELTFYVSMHPNASQTFDNMWIAVSEVPTLQRGQDVQDFLDEFEVVEVATEGWQEVLNEKDLWRLQESFVRLPLRKSTSDRRARGKYALIKIVLSPSGRHLRIELIRISGRLSLAV